MTIWHADYSLEKIRPFNEQKMLAHLGIELTELGDDFLEGTMPVDERTQQPFGYVHGGASAVLAESLGSIASNLVVDPTKYYCLGLSLNINHLKSAKNGLITGKTMPIHLGKTTHVWEIALRNEKNQLTAVARLTMSVMEIARKPVESDSAT